MTLYKRNVDGDLVELTSDEERALLDEWAEGGKVLPYQVNTERTRRLEQGTTIEVTGYGSVAVQGRDQDQITIIALEASARDLTAAGVTDLVIPFRDRDNVQHMLTPEQTTELMRKAKSFAQAVYQSSWALKDADPIPQDYTDDKHWL